MGAQHGGGGMQWCGATPISTEGVSSTVNAASRPRHRREKEKAGGSGLRRIFCLAGARGGAACNARVKALGW